MDWTCSTLGSFAWEKKCVLVRGLPNTVRRLPRQSATGPGQPTRKHFKRKKLRLAAYARAPYEVKDVEMSPVESGQIRLSVSSYSNSCRAKKTARNLGTSILSSRTAIPYLILLLAISSPNAASVPKGYVSALIYTVTMQFRSLTKPACLPPAPAQSPSVSKAGETPTCYEAPITSGPRNITLANTSGGEAPEGVPCNGLNHGANPDAETIPLDAAAKLRGFTYDGYCDTENEDSDIMRASPRRRDASTPRPGSRASWLPTRSATTPRG